MKVVLSWDFYWRVTPVDYLSYRLTKVEILVGQPFLCTSLVEPEQICQTEALREAFHQSSLILLNDNLCGSNRLICVFTYKIWSPVVLYTLHPVYSGKLVEFCNEHNMFWTYDVLYACYSVHSAHSACGYLLHLLHVWFMHVAASVWTYARHALQMHTFSLHTMLYMYSENSWLVLPLLFSVSVSVSSLLFVRTILFLPWYFTAC